MSTAIDRHARKMERLVARRGEHTIEVSASYLRLRNIYEVTFSLNPLGPLPIAAKTHYVSPETWDNCRAALMLAEREATDHSE